MRTFRRIVTAVSAAALLAVAAPASNEPPATLEVVADGQEGRDRRDVYSVNRRDILGREQARGRVHVWIGGRASTLSIC